MKTKIKALQDYDTFIDIWTGTKHLSGYKRISVKMVFDVKHDLRHRAFLCSARHRTNPFLKGTYSGVVCLKSMWIDLDLISALLGSSKHQVQFPSK